MMNIGNIITRDIVVEEKICFCREKGKIRNVQQPGRYKEGEEARTWEEERKTGDSWGREQKEEGWAGQRREDPTVLFYSILLHEKLLGSSRAVNTNLYMENQGGLFLICLLFYLANVINLQPF